MSTKRLVINAMARQSTNPSLLSPPVDEGVAGQIAPEHDAYPFDVDGNVTVVSSYVLLICVLLAQVA